MFHDHLIWNINRLMLISALRCFKLDTNCGNLCQIDIHGDPTMEKVFAVFDGVVFVVSRHVRYRTYHFLFFSFSAAAESS